MSYRGDIEKAIFNADKAMACVRRLVSKMDCKPYEDFVLLDEATFGIMYCNSSLNRLIVDIEIRQGTNSNKTDEKPQSHKKKKPQVRGRSSLGNSKVLKKPNHRTGFKTKRV
jgi:hypothetical protein